MIFGEMNMRIAIYGYGNLGKGVEAAVKQNSDAELVGIFTRRDPQTITTVTGAPVYRAEKLADFKGSIEVVIICGGSATDLPVLTPGIASDFNVVDSFDTHARIPEHFENVNKAALSGGKTALISCGWDPGLFSIARIYANSVLPDGSDYTFWGRGVSQGHSDAVRRIPGVADARQYTVPVEESVDAVRRGENPVLTARQKHRRECYVVACDGADKNEIKEAIVSMPYYFDEYDTSVEFITAEEMRQKHSGLPHGGSVIRNGVNGNCGEHKSTIEFSLKLDSNPEFTALVLVAFARAVFRLNGRGITGCKTVFDIAPADLSPLSADQIRRKFL